MIDAHKYQYFTMKAGVHVKYEPELSIFNVPPPDSFFARRAVGVLRPRRAPAFTKKEGHEDEKV